MDIPKSRGTILIVDDEPDTLWFISKTGQALGYSTLTAGSGMEALKIIQECGSRIDLVVLDLSMPGMSGIEVLRLIRQDYPQLGVIVLTAMHDEQKRCEQLGVDAFIRKPYSLRDLHDRIEVMIERKNEDKVPLEIESGWEISAKVLIVDDEEEVCDFLKSALTENVKDAHFEVACALSGDDALRISRTFEPDIGIIDIKMPHMWGDELIERFKAGEGYAPKDFIIYTAVDAAEELRRAKQLGYRFFPKPTAVETLMEVIKKICVKHKLLRKKP